MPPPATFPPSAPHGSGPGTTDTDGGSVSTVSVNHGPFSASTVDNSGGFASTSSEALTIRPSPRNLTYRENTNSGEVTPAPAPQVTLGFPCQKNMLEGTPNEKHLRSDRLNSILGNVGKAKQPDPPGQNTETNCLPGYGDSAPHHTQDEISVSTVTFNGSQSESLRSRNSESDSRSRADDPIVIPTPKIPPLPNVDQESLARIVLPPKLIPPRESNSTLEHAAKVWRFTEVFAPQLKNYPAPTLPIQEGSVEHHRATLFKNALDDLRKVIERKLLSEYAPTFVKTVAEKEGHYFTSTTCHLTAMQKEVIQKFRVLQEDDGRINKRNLATVLEIHKFHLHQPIKEALKNYIIEMYPNVTLGTDSGGKDFVDYIVDYNAASQNQRMRNHMKSYSGGVWYDIKSGLDKCYSGNHFEHTLDVNLINVSPAKVVKGFFLVPKKEKAPQKSIEFETGSSVLKVLDKSSNYEAFSSEMHKYLEQLWTVSD